MKAYKNSARLKNCWYIASPVLHLLFVQRNFWWAYREYFCVWSWSLHLRKCQSARDCKHRQYSKSGNKNYKKMWFWTKKSILMGVMDWFITSPLVATYPVTPTLMGNLLSKGLTGKKLLFSASEAHKKKRERVTHLVLESMSSHSMSLASRSNTREKLLPFEAWWSKRTCGSHKSHGSAALKNMNGWANLNSLALD